MNGTPHIDEGIFAQDWTLDGLGNFAGFQEDTDGDGVLDTDQTRDTNARNEIQSITAGGNPTDLAYDDAGTAVVAATGYFFNGFVGVRLWSAAILRRFSHCVTIPATPRSRFRPPAGLSSDEKRRDHASMVRAPHSKGG